MRLTEDGGWDRLAGMSRPRLLAVLAGLLAFAAAAPAAQLSSRAIADRAPRAFVIAGATVHLGDGTVLEGGSVALDDGLIVAVGEGVAAPPGAFRIDGEGKHLYPGFITALSDLGLGGGAPEGAARGPRGGGGGEPASRPPPSRGPEDRPDTFSWRLAADALSTADERIARRRSAGFTSAVSVPRGGIVSGRAAFLNLAGPEEVDPRDLVIAGDAALMVRLETRGFRSFPGSMMGVIAYLRQLFLDAAHYREVWRMYEEDPSGLPRPRYERALAPLAAAAGGEQPVLLPANLDKEIRRMVGLAQEFGIRPVLYGGHEAGSAADFLAEHQVPLLVDLNWPKADPEADPEAEVPLRVLRLRDRAPAGPAALAAAGVRFAFYRGETPGQSGGRRGSGGSGDDLAAVRKAVERGLDREAALTALTQAPAGIFGVEDRVGTLEAGKIANLVLADRDIFEEGASVEAVFVDGVIHRPEADEEAETDEDDPPEPSAGGNGGVNPCDG